MKFLGNILTDHKQLDDFELYNVVSDKNDLIEGIPTLIIGWEKTRLNYPDAKILDWEIEPNIYWTFGKREKRNQMEKDILRFKKIAMNKLIKRVKYTFLNILTANTEIKGRLYKSLQDETNKIIYINNDILYCYYIDSEKVIGISLRDVTYSGGDVKKIFSTIYQNPNSHIIKPEESYSIAAKYSLKNNLYVIPYLFS